MHDEVKLLGKLLGWLCCPTFILYSYSFSYLSVPEFPNVIALSLGKEGSARHSKS